MSELKTCFKKVDYDLSGLLHYIEIGDIALPDIQRPFVWSNAKVRDLFDSMYRGFPVGYFLFWENVVGNATKQIGVGSKQHTVARLLIVDGQQRLTSLFAVFRGRKVLDADYKERQIEVAFRPRDGKFEVADAAIRRDPEWIANISELWSSRSSSRKLVNTFIAKLAEKAPLTAEDEELIAHNLDRLFDLQKYPFTALEIASSVDEEQVADIFVRINSEGVRLNQADFILTLMSVFWDEGRTALETFCRHSRQAPSPGAAASPFNHFIQPDPDQLLRVGVAFGFQRGRLKSVYQVLRGKDMDTGEYSPERRDQQFAALRAAQDEVLNLTHWHQFLSCLIGAGFRSGEMISSQNALLYAYAFYLVGRKRFGLAEHQLQRLIGRWFFAASLTGRYTSSPETVMDGDLNRLKEVKDAAGFVATLEEIMGNELTNDFWTVTLPSTLDSSSARNPELFAYTAAQNRLGAPVLFSHKKVSDLLDPSIKTQKKPLERHHLFPRAWLEREGVDDLKRINQVGNFALLEWPDNIDISDTSPAEYVPQIRSRFSAEEWNRMHECHALPENWHAMPYDTFLHERRRLMAAIIRKGFESLKQVSDSSGLAQTVLVSPESTESWKTAIASSKPASSLQSESVVSKQNGWSNRPKQADLGDGLTKTEQLRIQYWTSLIALMKSSGSSIECKEPGPNYWIYLKLPLRGYACGFEISTRDQRVDVYFGTRSEDNAETFLQLQKTHKDEISRAIGEDLEWIDKKDKGRFWVVAYHKCDPANKDDWQRQQLWMKDVAEKMVNVFAKYLSVSPV